MLVLGIIGEAIISAGIWIVSGLYHVAAWAFELFLVLSSGQLLDVNVYSQMIKNFYIILGIIMLFFLSFTLLKGMVNPDDSKQGTSTVRKVITNLVTSSIIMALLPTIFTFLYDFQDSVISNQNTIGKFFGYGGSEDVDSPAKNVDKVKTGSYQIVNGVFSAFFNVTEKKCPVLTENNFTETKLEACQDEVEGSEAIDAYDTDKSLRHAISYVDQTGNFGVYTNFTKNVDRGEVDFNFLLALVAGALLVYVGISFSIDMGVRLVKLVFYQLIAPIPIFARVIPDTKLSSSFNQWLKITLTCYMEVYVRIFILYFDIFLCKKMIDSPFLMENVYQYGVFIGLFAKAFVLMGIIIFMRQAPKLLSDVTGLDTGNMKLGIKDKLKDAGVFAAGNAIGSLIASPGNPLAAVRGWKHGWSNANMQDIGAEAQRRRDYKEARKNGATRTGIALNKIRSAFGYDTIADSETRRIENAAYDVKNMSATDIKYVDSNGAEHTIAAGAGFKLDSTNIEFLKSKKAENIGKMSEANERLRRIDSDIDYNNNQRNMIKTLESEADADFEKGKYLATVSYDDGTGKITTKNVTSEEFKELQKLGYTFYDSDGKTQISINDVRGNIRRARIIGEASSSSGNLIKRAEEEFIKSLYNNGGYSYESFNYDKNGIKLVDKKGKALVNSGSFNVKEDGTISHIQKQIKVDDEGKAILDNDGNAILTVTDTTYTRDSNGQYKRIVKDENGTEISSDYIDVYDFSKLFDIASKTNSNVLAAKQQDIKELELQSYESENKGIDNIIKQGEEAKDAAKQSVEHRKRESEKAYHANKK